MPNFFCPRTEKENFYFVVFAGIQKMRMCLIRLFFAFSMLALTNLSICSFALMQKNQKIKAVMPSLKMDCVPLKCLNLLRLRLRFGQQAFFNAALHPFS